MASRTPERLPMNTTMSILLLITVLVLVGIWTHGVVRERRYLDDVRSRASDVAHLAVPGLVSPVAARPRLQAELARGTRSGHPCHLAVATCHHGGDPVVAAREIAAWLPDDALGLLWPSGDVVVVMPGRHEPPSLPKVNSVSWQAITSNDMSSVHDWLGQQEHAA